MPRASWDIMKFWAQIKGVKRPIGPEGGDRTLGTWFQRGGGGGEGWDGGGGGGEGWDGTLGT